MQRPDLMNKNRVYFKPKSNVPAFLVKTYDILENPVHFDIISWNKEGTAFLVKNVNDFSEKILPKYFKHNNFSSFVRQLNMYDFHKSKQDNKENEFRHKLFRRGQKHLLADIKRKGAEHNHFAEEQMLGATKAAELNKVKKNANVLNEELSNVKTQQGELEKIGKMIYSQNTQLLNENKLLWAELNKNKEKYENKVEKLMMFIYSVMNQPGNEALGSLPVRKMLMNSENADPNKILQNIDQSTDGTSPNQKLNLSPPIEKTTSDKAFNQGSTFFPDKKPEPLRYDNGMMDPNQNKPRSPPLFNTSTPTNLSGLSTHPNTPNLGPLMGSPAMNGMPGPTLMPGMFTMGHPQMMTNPMMSGMAGMQPIQPAYPSQAYFSIPVDNNSNMSNMNGNQNIQGSNVKRDSPKLGRPAPTLDAADSKEFRENPVKMVKKDSDYQTSGNITNPLFMPNNQSEDPLKLEEWPFALNLSRGPSLNAGDMNTSRFNSLNMPRMPSDFTNFAPLQNNNSMKENVEPQNFSGPGRDLEGIRANGLMEQGIPYFNAANFMRHPSGVYGFNLGQPAEDALYTN